ncbi:MAG: RNA ligase family protein [Bryobacteraceae bacterium]
MRAIVKYPRTRHVEGSRLQPGDFDMSAVPVDELRDKHLVVEEKVDGSNAAVSFDGDGMLLQSRGHALTGGANERQFGLFKSWAAAHQHAFREVLGERYVMYGEWLYAKHTIFYDALPHYFLEFDVLDRETGWFLDTAARRRLLHGLPVCSVRVLAVGSGEDPRALAGPSAFRTSNWRERLRAQCVQCGVDADRAIAESDSSLDMEGLYIKWEQDGQVKGRYKYVRASFLTAVADSMSHWMERPLVPNLLAPGVRLHE